MTKPIYPPIPENTNQVPSPSVTVIPQTNIFQIGDYTLVVSVDESVPTRKIISMQLQDDTGTLLSGMQFAGNAWLVNDDGTGEPEGEDVFKRSPIFTDSPGGSEWDLCFVDGEASLTLERAAYSIPFYFVVRILGCIYIRQLTLGS
jgi:hypothetical protein